MTPSKDKNGYALRCNRTAHHKQWGVEPCGNTSFKLTEVEEKVWAKVVRFARDWPYMEERLDEALGKLARPDHEKELANHRARKYKLKAKLSKLMDQWGDSEDPVLAEAAKAGAEKIAREIAVEDGLIAEIESTLLLAQEKKAILQSVIGSLDQHIGTIETADFDQRCNIMDALNVSVKLGYLTPYEMMPEGLRATLDLAPDPNATRQKTVKTEVFASDPSRRPSVGRKFSR
jgi:hypothetical protein